ncbi:bifunctional adenosylcobinamide kinase/adenosylcobinamide-phosphate guanylyltransferase [uncultured Draconibacterium sp.]|uniref:bifunctional adenosylcobinamide kinase/adenosylcobinamide-phosphate guanylyltransferase n=1 Tax=uncultured Draconibacterium sp. TaxID=1573823 RepID=UPI0032618D4C
MAQITFITGGQRSGKSSYAQKRVEENFGTPIYLATAHIWDEDFHNRVKRHQSDRGEQWTTIEEEIEISKHDLVGKTVLLDCVTLWLTNIFYHNENDVDSSLEIAKLEWDNFINQDMDLFVVSNELGMGIHPENEIARKFADLQGWMNQYIAQNANEVILMVSGVPVQVKSGK